MDIFWTAFMDVLQEICSLVKSLWNQNTMTTQKFVELRFISLQSYSYITFIGLFVCGLQIPNSKKIKK